MKSGLKCLCLVSIVCFLLGMFPTLSIAANPEFTLRYAGNLPIDSYVTRSMEFFAKLVDQKSNGRVKIEVYPASTLFSATDMPRALPSGAVDMCEVVIAQWSGQVPAVLILDAIFYYTDWAHLFRAEDSEAGRMIAKEMEKANVKLLHWNQDGSGGFASKLPLKKLEDFKGLRIRSYSEICSVLIKAFGAAPTFMGGGEVYMALQRGTVDGAMSTLNTFTSRKYFEVSKYISGVGALYGVNACLINLDKWNSLPPDVQKILQEAGVERMAWGRKEVVRLDTEDLELLKNKGMDVYHLPKDEFERWKKTSKPVMDYILERIGPMGPKLIEEIEKVR